MAPDAYKHPDHLFAEFIRRSAPTSRVEPASWLRWRWLAQPMHSSVTGRALRRSVAIGRRHEQQSRTSRPPPVPSAGRPRPGAPLLVPAGRRSALARMLSWRPQGRAHRRSWRPPTAATMPSNSALKAPRRSIICPRSSSSIVLAALAVITPSEYRPAHGQPYIRVFAWRRGLTSRRRRPLVRRCHPQLLQNELATERIVAGLIEEQGRLGELKSHRHPSLGVVTVW